ncbi:plasmid mobilization relaxosome protein MobC [Flavobacterium psychroterrae]|uniref:Plasmid mobilization relaxosome protein MobC n=2 Tax=Flavobacterium psychroterrae TaxID=2133767 RepID=A0ABS5PIQ6_9FLAO|nr:plasmid mobilization relaxosome protein MobC [Flavobacterium psychroterrae]
MKEKTDYRTQWLHVRLSPEEYQKLLKAQNQSTCRKLSDYARHMLFQKPIRTTFRNQSLDDLTAEMIVLNKELNAIGNNLNQSVKKLHTISQLVEFRAWIAAYEVEKTALSGTIEEIKKYMQKVEQRWLQS